MHPSCPQYPTKKNRKGKKRDLERLDWEVPFFLRLFRVTGGGEEGGGEYATPSRLSLRAEGKKGERIVFPSYLSGKEASRGRERRTPWGECHLHSFLVIQEINQFRRLSPLSPTRKNGGLLKAIYCAREQGMHSSLPLPFFKMTGGRWAFSDVSSSRLSKEGLKGTPFFPSTLRVGGRERGGHFVQEGEGTRLPFPSPHPNVRGRKG